MATVDKLPMLAEGYEKLQTDVRHLKTVERPAIIDAIEEARGHGDLSENAEYHAAKERQGQVESQIADLEDRISRAMVIDPKTLSGDKVVFGATVHLLDENDNKIKYQIVGETEADAKSGRISYASPLGRALIGRMKGEEVEFSAPSGDKYYEIRKIEFR
jgi:transcription elongation factor GreA